MKASSNKFIVRTTGLGIVGSVTVLFCSLSPALAQDVERASLRTGGAQANGGSSGSSTSRDGRCVAFYSDATNLLPQGSMGDTNGVRDVFVFDRTLLQSQRVSVSSAGDQGNGPSQAQGFLPAIDGNCSCVAFSSDATNLVAGDTNQRTDVFVRDLGAAATSIVSRAAGTEGNGTSSFPGVSQDCGIVVFQSSASNLVDGDSNNASDIFLADRTSGVLSRVSVAAGNVQANGRSLTPAVSADGACVAFVSTASNLLGVDSNGRMDVYVACGGVVTCRASVDSAGAEANNDSFLPSLSADGRLVAFKSLASNLVAGDLNGAADVFVHDCQTGTTERVSISSRGEPTDDNSFPPSISGDGRFVAFGSFASNLATGLNTKGKAQIYVRDRLAGTTLLVSQTPDGQAANGSSPDIPPSISFDGTFVAFASFATDLVPGDTNEVIDAFLGPNNTATPSRTATPLVCTTQNQCPGGQVCVDGQCLNPTLTPTPTPTIACTETAECPEGQVCADGICRFPTQTPTPTPPIGCFIDLDCPQGHVCLDGVCTVLPCDSNDDCPGGRVCEDGICQPLPMTPTPLPTCMEDDDCPDPERCRAMVCVPPRPCSDEDPVLDRVNCRGQRETCVDGACECGGDCNFDGIVFGNEISIGVGILGGVVEIQECPTADIFAPRDGEVMGNEITLAVLNLGLGCPGEGLPLEIPRQRETEIRTLAIGAGAGVRGGIATVTVSLAGGADVATTQLDVLYDTSIVEIGDPAAACRIDSRLAGTHQLQAFRPQRPNTAPGISRLRLFVGDLMFPVDSFGEGALVTCEFTVKPTATMGTFVLVGERVNVGDSSGAVFDGRTTDGSIVISDCLGNGDCPTDEVCKDGACLPTCDDQEDCPDDLICRNGICSIGDCETSADCPAAPRQVCVASFCECTGDCNGDGNVFGNEITIGVRVLAGEELVAACLAADANSDGSVFSNEITLGVINLGEGCPTTQP